MNDHQHYCLDLVHFEGKLHFSALGIVVVLRKYVVLVKSCRQSKDADSKFA